MILQTPFKRQYRGNEYLFQFHSTIKEDNIRRFFEKVLLNGLPNCFHDPNGATASTAEYKSIILEKYGVDCSDWKPKDWKKFNLEKFSEYNIDLENISLSARYSKARGYPHEHNGRTAFIRYNPTVNNITPGDGIPDSRREYLLLKVTNKGDDTLVDICSPRALRRLREDSKYYKHFTEGLPFGIDRNSLLELEEMEQIPFKNGDKQHDVVQKSLMKYVSPVIACEVPVWGKFNGETYTTFIDAIAYDYWNKGVFILDYKPNAIHEKSVIAQLLVGKELFHQRTGYPLEKIRIAWFDENHYFIA